MKSILQQFLHIFLSNAGELLSYVAQTEREFIRQRQAEGIAAAKANGVHFGRRALEKPMAWEKVYETWQRGEISGRAAAQRLGVSHTTFQNWEKCTTNELMITGAL